MKKKKLTFYIGRSLVKPLTLQKSGDGGLGKHTTQEITRSFTLNKLALWTIIGSINYAPYHASQNIMGF